VRSLPSGDVLWGKSVALRLIRYKCSLAMLFVTNRNVQAETVILPEHLRDEQDVPTATERPEGPYDISEIESREFSKGYMDLGTIKVPMRKNVSYRLEQEQA